MMQIEKEFSLGIVYNDHLIYFLSGRIPVPIINSGAAQDHLDVL